MILFRVDSNSLTASGHMMRCLALAEYLVQKGYKTSFLMREPSVSSIQRVIDAGHDLIHLKSTGLKKKIHGSSSLYSNYLTVSEEVDAIETGIIANNLDAVCVIVDHYALGAVWHNIVRKNCDHVVVIDDLDRLRRLRTICLKDQ